MPHRVTMREVAKAAGVSLATVSRVLSRHPHIEDATRKKVERALKRTGYQVDPALRAIASCRWQDRRTKEGEVLAWLDFAPAPSPPPEAAHAAAAKEGYRLEHFRAGEIPSARRLGDLLYHRGISGVVLVNSAETPDLPDFPWDRFCAVSCWTAYARNPVDCVRFNPFETVRAGLERLVAAGCRRPGLILVHDARGLSFANDKMLGSYEHHGRKLLGRAPARPLLARIDHIDDATLLDWFRRERPDGIIGHHDGIYFQLRHAGLRMPEQARYLSLMAQKEAAGVAHFSNMRDRCAEVAVEQLVLRLRYNQRGIPSHPMDFVLAPVWVPGKTCPESPQATPAPRIRRRPE